MKDLETLLRNGKVLGVAKKPMDVNFATIRDQWIKDGRIVELILFVHENWDSGNCDAFIEPFETHLVKERDVQSFKILWKGIIKNRLDKITDLLRFRKMMLSKFPSVAVSEKKIHAQSQERKSFLLAGLNRFKSGLLKIGDITDTKKIDEFITSIKKDAFRGLQKKTENF